MSIKKIPVSFVILAFYLIASGYFAFERILNVDNSYFFFQIINHHEFWFPENRAGIFVSQLPLLFFAHIGTPLKALVYIYSLTFPIWYMAIAAFCHYYLKVKEASLALAFCLILGVAYSFLHPVTETYHALVFSVLLYAVLVSPKLVGQKVGYYIAILVVSILCIIAHPIGAFTIGFVAIFSFVNKQVKMSPAIFILILAGVSMLLRVWLVPKGSYDVKQYDNLFASLRSISEFGNLYPVTYLKTRSINVYFPTILLIAVLGVLAIKTKHKLVFGVSAFCSLGFTVIGVLTFSKGDADMMMEKTFLPAIFMLVLPFCYLYVRQQAIEKIALTIVVLMLTALSFNQIFKASRIATNRLSALQSIAAQSVHPKLIAQFTDFEDHSLHFNHWNTGIDSYILAKCKLNKNFTLFLVEDKRAFIFDSANVDLFLGPTWFPHWNQQTLDPRYVTLPKVPYKVLPNN